MTNHKYCVYLTIYSGTKLPPFYIGSTSIEKIRNGYNGSVSSKKWKYIYEQEQKENKYLFKTEIISTFKTRVEAIKRELELQIKSDVVKSTEYFNESLACANGCFGRDMRGPLHPLYGKGHNQATRDKISKNHHNVSGKNNPKSKLIKIFNSRDEIVFETNGNFKNVCEEHDLPFASLKLSYQHGGVPLYTNLTERGYKTIKSENIQFKGWYAIST